MTFAAVTWSYKDTVTSAKLAQMIENIRTHEHLTTDQGARFGIIAAQGLSSPAQVVNSVVATAITGSALNFTITANDAASRMLLIIRKVGVHQGSGATTQALITETMSGTGFTSWTGRGVIQLPSGSLSSDVNYIATAVKPPAGTYTTTASVQFTVAAASNTVDLLGPTIVALL